MKPKQKHFSSTRNVADFVCRLFVALVALFLAFWSGFFFLLAIFSAEGRAASWASRWFALPFGLLALGLPWLAFKLIRQKSAPKKCDAQSPPQTAQVSRVMAVSILTLGVIAAWYLFFRIL